MTKIELVELLTNNRSLYYRQLLRMSKAELLAMVEDRTDPRTSEQKRADADARYRAMLVDGKMVVKSNAKEMAAKRRIAKRFANR